jgi:hypothetical protein
LKKDQSFSELLERVWCPICFSELKVEPVPGSSGAKKLVCPKHGDMKTYVKLPKVGDSRGITDLEAGARVTAAIAESTFEGVS